MKNYDEERDFYSGTNQMGWTQIIGVIVTLAELSGLVVIVEIFIHSFSWPVAIPLALFTFWAIMVCCSGIYLRYKLPMTFPMERLYFIDHVPIYQLAPQRIKKIAPYLAIGLFCVFSFVLLPIDIFQCKEFGVIGTHGIIALQEQLEIDNENL